MDAFEKIIGYEDVKHELYKVCEMMKNPEKYKKIGVRKPHGILLFGKPGNGKTMMANALIHESGRKAFVLRKDRPDEEFINHIREVFEEAKKTSPCIVFLDNLDKFSDQDSAEEYATIQTCIDECQEYEVFVLATVNFLRDIPDSLLRVGRFDHIIQMFEPVKKDQGYLINVVCDENGTTYYFGLS